MAKAQLEIPGTERPVIKAIETAAEAYVDLRDKRMSLLEKEIQAKENLINVMMKHQDKLPVDGNGCQIYRYDEQLVILSVQDAVKVKKVVEETGDKE